MSSIYVLGHIIIETIVFPDGHVLGPVLGSPAAYSSVALARLGNDVCLCTRAGEDLPEEFHRAFLDAGVCLDGMKIEESRSSRNRLVYTSPDAKDIEFLHKAAPITLDDIPHHANRDAVFYVCPMDYEVTPSEVQELAGRGGSVIADLGGYGGATSSTHPLGRSELLEPTAVVAASCTLVKASIEDCRDLFGPTDSLLPARVYARRLLDLGSRLVVLTLGRHGVYVADGAREMLFDALPCRVRDTTGAGDAFSAGMIHAYRQDSQNWSRFVQFGQATACWVLERSGGVAPERMPTAADVQRLLSEEARDA